MEGITAIHELFCVSDGWFIDKIVLIVEGERKLYVKGC